MPAFTFALWTEKLKDYSLSSSRIIMIYDYNRDYQHYGSPDLRAAAYKEPPRTPSGPWTWRGAWEELTLGNNIQFGCHFPGAVLIKYCNRKMWIDANPSKGMVWHLTFIAIYCLSYSQSPVFYLRQVCRRKYVVLFRVSISHFLAMMSNITLAKTFTKM